MNQIHEFFMRISVLQVLFVNVDQLLICLKLDIFVRKILVYKTLMKLYFSSYK